MTSILNCGLMIMCKKGTVNFPLEMSLITFMQFSFQWVVLSFVRYSLRWHGQWRVESWGCFVHLVMWKFSVWWLKSKDSFAGNNFWWTGISHSRFRSFWSGNYFWNSFCALLFINFLFYSPFDDVLLWRDLQCETRVSSAQILSAIRRNT